MRLVLRSWSWSPLFAIWTLLALVQFSLVTAQSTSSNSNSASSATSASVSVTTSNVTSTFTTTSNAQTSTGVTVIQVTSTLTPSATTSDNATASASASASASAGPSLDTKIDPGFGVLGAILIITGLPSAFWGHKNRWSSFFLIGFYTFALSCFALILKFGVLEAISPPDAKLRGVFVLACSIAGIIGGAVAIFFWQQAKYFIGAWGGFTLGLWIQTFREGGLIRPVGYRWILYIGLAVAGFCLCTLPKIHYHVLLASTAAVGASAFVLGIDCYTTANLKEFYVANLGFNSLFTKFEENGIQFPISQLMQIEIGLIAAFTLMGAAVQLRILKVLQRKLKEIAMEQKKRDEDLENQAAARFSLTAKELAEWEKEHGRVYSHFSGLPLLKHQDAQSPNTEEGSTLVMDGQRRSRYQSGVSEFMVVSGPADDRQSSGALPAIDLGGDLEADLAKDFDTERSNSISSSRGLSPQEREELKKKEDLMAEITNIRKSIEQLRASTPVSSAEGGSHSRNPSFTSRRTLSLGLAEALDGPSRPPRATDPRARVHSMDRLSMSPDAFAAGASINRPSSVPLQDDTNWNEYVRERKLFQPPSGVSAPIAPSPVAPIPQRAPVPVPDAVAEALARRRQQEAAFEAGEFGRKSQHLQSASHNMIGDRPSSTMWSSQPNAATTNSKPPVTILPPKKPEPGQKSRALAPRVHTFEELNERHREKMRDLQAPLSQAEQEQARLAEARYRWEHSKEVEKQIMAKKLAEKEAALKQRQEEKTKKQGEVSQRSLSADKLNKLPGALASSSRQSMMKVEDWRRYQQEMDTSPARSKSPAKRDSTVPFPAAQGGREPGHHQSSSTDRRRG